MPAQIVVYLNEQKVKTLSAAAVLADEFVLTHRTAFTSSPQAAIDPSTDSTGSHGEERECFYCHKPGHIIANCPSLKRKEQAQTASDQSSVKGVGVIKRTRYVNC